MAKVYEFISNGSEEVEALIPVDVLRSAGVEVQLFSTTGNLEILSSHNVRIVCDALIEDVDTSDADLLMVPGGLPGAENNCNHPLVREKMLQQFKAGKLVAAICAGPMLFGSLGISDNKRCTCYPGFENRLSPSCTYTHELVTVDGNVVTGEGPAATFPYAYTLCSLLCGKEKAAQLSQGMMFDHLMEGRN